MSKMTKKFRTRPSAGTVMTVTGPVASGALGVILPHEHILIDIRNQFVEPSCPEKARIGRERVSMAHLGLLRRTPYALKDNLVIADLDTAIAELGRFKDAWGGTIVDCTVTGIGRDVRKLREAARRTGLNIIAGCGYFTADTHPPAMAAWTAEEIAGQLIADLTVGIDGTDIKAGVIGEIGVSHPVAPHEVKNLRAAALAHKRTGVPVYVHTYPWSRAGLMAAGLLLKEGVAPEKIVICHTDVECKLPYMKAVLSRGVFLEFDNFGKEFYISKADRGFAGGSFSTDLERIRLIRKLVEQGFGDRILITNDVCLKSMLHACGGWGYDHILTNIVPMMLDEGIPRETINRFLTDNPARLLEPARAGV